MADIQEKKPSGADVKNLLIERAHLKPHMEVISHYESIGTLSAEEKATLEHHRKYVFYAMNYELNTLGYRYAKMMPEARKYVDDLGARWGLIEKYPFGKKNPFHAPESVQVANVEFPPAELVYPLTVEERYIKAQKPTANRVRAAMRQLRSNDPTKVDAGLKELGLIAKGQGVANTKYLLKYLPDEKEKNEFLKLVNKASKPPREEVKVGLVSQEFALGLLKRSARTGKPLHFDRLTSDQVVAIQKALKLKDLRELAVKLPSEGDRSYVLALNEKLRNPPKAPAKAAPKPIAPMAKAELPRLSNASKRKILAAAFRQEASAMKLSGPKSEDYIQFSTDLWGAVNSFDEGSPERAAADKYYASMDKMLSTKSAGLKFSNAKSTMEIESELAMRMFEQRMETFRSAEIPTDPKTAFAFLMYKGAVIHYINEGVAQTQGLNRVAVGAFISETMAEMGYDPQKDMEQYTAMLAERKKAGGKG